MYQEIPLIRCDYSMTTTARLNECDRCKQLSTTVFYPASGGVLCEKCYEYKFGKSEMTQVCQAFINTPEQSFDTNVTKHEGLHDPVNHPKHYCSHPSGVECIEITRHMLFNRGNAIKYIWRAGEKSSEIEDLKKAIFYLTDEIARLEKLSVK